MALNNKTLLSVALTVVCISLANAKSFQIQPRLSRGEFAEQGKFPFMVSLFDNRCGIHICGGSIISDRFILSAANCYNYYKNHPKHVSASIGSNKFMGKGGVIKKITNIVLHHAFDGQNHHNDLALFKTLDSIVFTKYIKPIALPTEKYNGIGEKVLTSGFGGAHVSIDLMFQINLRI